MRPIALVLTLLTALWISPAAAAPEPKAVFLGASIIQYWRREDPAFFTANAIVNRGIAGETSDQVLARADAALALKPTVLVVLAGTNDVALRMPPRQTLENLSAIARKARAQGVRVVICAIPPSSQMSPASIDAANALTRAFAGREGFVYLDFAPVLGAPDGGMRADLSRDGTHPNAQGYALMEPLVLAAMRQAQAGQ